jgi:CRISPR-associated endonuclease Csn1
MAEIFSLDLGTNSIGYTKRNTDIANTLSEQLEIFGSLIFKKGVGNGKTGEYSFAAERTKHRSSRRLYQARKYRIWRTLEVLIENGYCPLSIEDLDKWKKYDKAKGLKRQYPIDAVEFEQWVRLDFDGDGKADYSSPYQLRAELATLQLDFSLKINRFKLGRALYHIAQRRGFKSSKGETLKEQEENTKENVENVAELDISALKKSEEKQSQRLTQYIKENDLQLPTVGCILYQIEKEGKRIRGSVIEKTGYQAVRSQYKEEVKYIFEFQNGLDTNSDFFYKIYSDRKDGSIFYKRPLRSQKGLVGKCTLEPTKYRCPISHPEFEKFRAFAFINNIQYRNSIDDEWRDLSADQKLRLYNDKFLRTKANFKFEELREWLENDVGHKLPYGKGKASSLINYKDKTNVAGCPISGRLKNLLSEDWEKWEYATSQKRKDEKGNEHTINYSMEDVWHICFSYDDDEHIVEFAKDKLGFDDKKAKSLVNLWVGIPQGYSMLSLKAIRNINRFLIPDVNKKGYDGLIYTDAALLAKIPEVLGEELWQQNEQLFFDSINDLTIKNREEKHILNIANSLIANYKTLEQEEQFAYKNTTYQLDKSDLKDIENYTKEAFGEKTWEKDENKEKILAEVQEKYQHFFASSKRDYYKLPKLGDTIKQFLTDNFDFLTEKQLNKLYHPSMIEFYKPAKESSVEYKGVQLSKKLLESPVIGAFKNPMAMRTLHELRKLMNYLLLEGKIDEDTRIVVETARDLNDANMRWAIEKYQNEREVENKAIAAIIRELKQTENEINDTDIDKARLLIEQNRDYLFDENRYKAELEIKGTDDKKKGKFKENFKNYLYKAGKEKEKEANYIKKYKLWLEQGMKCLYTGKVINISDLLDGNKTDFEHTIPRSISFDNSLANLTVCDAYYNRHIKKNQIPTQLPNYEKDSTINGKTYTAIKPRLEAWEHKVEQLRNNVEFWKQKSKQAQIKETKDQAIRQRHLWQMELDYWQNKLERFTMTEVTSGFKNSQLNDTRLITKYAYHYLKSVFSKVEVQKGSVTADFRKMLGIHSMYEKKSRDKHSHHAIDAAILACIPVAAKRDRMLELFYKIQENKKLHIPTDREEQELEREKKTCNIGNITNLVKHIEDNILINHVSKDQTLTPAKRKARKRGKIIWLRDETGNIVLDERGNKTPKMWIKGDSIRGKLHKESFLGAITQAEKNENGTLKRNEDGSIISGEQIFYVIRKELKFAKSAQDAGFQKLDDVTNQIVDKNVGEIIAKQCEGKTFKEACEEGLYMFDKKENKVNRIRHIRCYTSIKNPLKIKEQIYKSTKEYKKHYYAETGDLYVMCKYLNEDKTKSIYEVFSLFDVSLNRKMGLEDIPKTTKDKKRIKYYLDIIYTVGDKVLLYNDNKEEITSDNFKKRLFVIQRFESDGRINLKHHLTTKEATSSQKTFEKSPDKYVISGKIKDWNNLPQAIRSSANGLNFLIEGKDFEMKLDGTIILKQ